jgi:hypothetical protein
MGRICAGMVFFYVFVSVFPRAEAAAEKAAGAAQAARSFFFDAEKECGISRKLLSFCYLLHRIRYPTPMIKTVSRMTKIGEGRKVQNRTPAPKKITARPARSL